MADSVLSSAVTRGRSTRWPRLADCWSGLQCMSEHAGAALRSALRRSPDGRKWRTLRRLPGRSASEGGWPTTTEEQRSCSHTTQIRIPNPKMAHKFTSLKGRREKI